MPPAPRHLTQPDPHAPARFPRRTLLRLLGAATLLGAGGCASVSVQPEAGLRPSAGQRPVQLLVAAFGAPADVLRVDRQGGELARFQDRLTAGLRAQTVRRLAALGVPAAAVAPADRLPPQPAWLVTGRFTRVNQGSRALRVGVGLGAGGTKMETRVEVRDLSLPGQPVVTAFRTTGGSNAEPGLIASGGTGPVSVAVGAAATVAGQSVHGVTEDTGRTARMIAAFVSETLAGRGYLDPARVRHAKRLGESR